MEQTRLRRQLLLTAVTMALMTVTLCGATFAWFSSNRKVNTSRAEARTGTGDLKLLVSASENGPFAETCEIVQVNATKPEKLMPVSTADLKTFYYCPATEGEVAKKFARVTDEAYYYHGRVYLQAVAEGGGWDGAQMLVYLDASSDTGPLTTAQGDLLTAARLGLSSEQGGNQPVIFKLSDARNSHRSEMNTAGASEGMVLDSTGTATADPAVSLETCTLQPNADRLPETPVLRMTLNTVYQLDVYFYLEGCDPDCNETISTEECELYLGFFGVLDSGGEAG